MNNSNSRKCLIAIGSLGDKLAPTESGLADHWQVRQYPSLQAVSEDARCRCDALVVPAREISHEIVQRLRREFPDAPIIVDGFENDALQWADDRIALPHELPRLGHILEHATECRREALERDRLKDTTQTLEADLEACRHTVVQIHQACKRWSRSRENAAELYRGIVDVFQEFSHAKRASLMLVEDSGNPRLRVVEGRGMPSEAVGATEPVGNGVAGWVAAHNEPLVNRLPANGRPADSMRGYTNASFVSLPLSVDGRVLGVKNLTNRHNGGPFTENDLGLLQMVAEEAAIWIEENRRLATLREMTLVDELTGLYNRRHLFDSLRREVARVQRTGHPLALAMADIDHFKVYNDTNGHQAGDHALRAVGQRLKKSVRATDTVARYGGEEFAVILPEPTTTGSNDGPAEVVQRLVESVRECHIPGEEAQPNGQLTISVGAAYCTAERCNIKELLRAADVALYQAKNAGRDCARII